MGESNDEKSNVTNPKAAAKEVTKPVNNIATAARKLRLILSSRNLLIMKKTMILEALNQAENEAETKVEAALATKGDLKSDKAEVDKDNGKDSNKNKDKGKDNDNEDENPPNPSTSASDRAESPFAAVQVDEVNQAQAAIRSLKRHGASAQAAESPADVQQNMSADNVPPMTPKAPEAPKATTSVTTRSGRVVKPSQKARDVKGVMNKKRTTTTTTTTTSNREAPQLEAASRTRTKTRARGGAKGRIKGGAIRSNSAPPAATVNMKITRSGRVVKPSLKAR